MTSDQDRARLIASRIARRVSDTRSTAGSSRKPRSGEIGAELSAMRASLDSLGRQLTQLESRLDPNEIDAGGFSSNAGQESSRFWAPSGSTQSSPIIPFVSGTYFPVAHPSQEKFGVEEATVSELVDFFESDKKCEIEPGGKPCDHCAMCSSRGF